MKQIKRKVSKKTKRKVSTKQKKRINKKTRRFRKQYGGKLNDEQITFIKSQIQDLGFTDAQKEELLGYFNQISQHLSKQSLQGINPRTGNVNTLLDEFFKNVEQNYRSDSTPEEKKEVFLQGFRYVYFAKKDADPDTDNEDDA